MSVYPKPIIGFLNIDKPKGWTSHDVVAKVRRITGIQRVGHAGTLDPMATGVLLICLGQATRLAEYVTGLRKVYVATICFGIETDTWDAEGNVISQTDASSLRLEKLSPLLEQFQGEIDQVPPLYSAIKKDGQPLYRLARQGISAAPAPRRVCVDAIRVLAWEPPCLVVEITCSAGTYIRSIAHDLGKAAGTGAHLAALTRTAIGHLTLENAVSLETLANATGDTWRRWLLSPSEVLKYMPSITLSPEKVVDIAYGRPIHLEQAPLAEQCLAYDAHGTLLAVLRAGESSQVWYPHKVFIEP